MKITYGGLLAGVRFLQVHCEGFDDGTGDDFHVPFIRDLLTEIFRASGITLEMPDGLPNAQLTIALTDHQGKGRLLVFLAGLDDEH